jgi:predicted acylesterase/phospholipase RssA
MLSYFHGQSFTDGIRTAVGDTRIEDLWIRYFCVTTNVSTHDLLVHDRGEGRGAGACGLVLTEARTHVCV